MTADIKSRRRSPKDVRAIRFPLQVPVRYRADDGSWRRGTTENISRSGLLLRVDEAVAPSTPIEMVVELPPIRAGARPAQVVCRGHIVRTIARPGATSTVLAATIAHYRLCRLRSAKHSR